MSWSQLRKQMRSFFCESLAKRLDFHITSYRRDSSSDMFPAPGRGWITLDGEEIVSFSSPIWPKDRDSLDAEERASRQDFYEVIKDYPQLSIEEALNSTDYLIQGFAVIDRRVGKKRLLRINPEELHPFVRTLYELRRSTI